MLKQGEGRRKTKEQTKDKQREPVSVQKGFLLTVSKHGKTKHESKTDDLESVLNSIVDQVEQERLRSSCMILKASTGLGKSTVFIHRLFKRFVSCKVVCSQITIVNTMSLCKYVAASQEGMQMGMNIGFQTSTSKSIPTDFHSIMYQTTRLTTLRYLIELQKGTLSNPQNYIIVIDEAHTNDVNSQEQLAIIRNLLTSKPREQLPFFIIQSASIDAQAFANYFEQEGYVAASGARYPVKELFIEDFGLSSATDFQNTAVSVVESIVKSAYFVPRMQDTSIGRALSELKIDKPKSILIFIAKQKQMTDLEEGLKKSKVFQDSKLGLVLISAPYLERDNQLISRNDNETPKVFISTNVIETGYTINNLSFVIDCMKFKQLYRNPISKVEIIRDVPIDQQMQQQRRGRVGRTQPGIYVGICKKEISDVLIPKKELQIQINNIQQTIAQFGVERFLDLKFMTQVPFEHCLDYLQLQALIGEQNFQNTNYNIVQSLLFSGIYFREVRQIILIILAMNQGIRLLDMIVLMAAVMQPGRFKPDRTKEVNDFSQMIENLYSGKLSSPELSAQTNQFIGFFKQHNFNIYQGIPFSDPQAQSRFLTCISLAYYHFMFERKSDTLFVSKQGLKVQIKLPNHVKYFVAMNVELQDYYQCKNIVAISEKHWNMVPCS